MIWKISILIDKNEQREFMLIFIFLIKQVSKTLLNINKLYMEVTKIINVKKLYPVYVLSVMRKT